SPGASLFLDNVDTTPSTNTGNKFETRLLPRQQFSLIIKPLTPAISKLTSDILFGASYTYTISQIDPNNVVTVKDRQTRYIYYYVDASDDSATDSTLKFADTLGDGHLPGGIDRSRTVSYVGDLRAKPTIKTISLQDDFYVAPLGGAEGFVLVFDP